MMNEDYYRRQFLVFDANAGKFSLTWNWSAAIFGGLWQFFRGLYLKLFAYHLVFLSVEYLVWSFFTTSAALFYPIFYFLFFIFYGVVSNYDFYLKKTRDEGLWVGFSSKNFKNKILIIIVIIIGSLFFFSIFFGNFWKGVNQSLGLIQKIDKRIEEQLKVKCDIGFKAHLTATQNLYDLNIELNLKPDQVLSYNEYEIIRQIASEELRFYGRLRQAKIYVSYDESYSSTN